MNKLNLKSEPQLGDAGSAAQNDTTVERGDAGVLRASSAPRGARRSSASLRLRQQDDGFHLFRVY